mmetsp:Transcript_122125/g.390577  ORF Transcript_122125/g.390577 Transcript_122125/m.390577 type:complete len:303 (+) Transcript_122125:28-936(+)
MAFRPQSVILIAALVSLCLVCGLSHPCDAEMQAACPDRPAEEIATCLKNPSEHETPTVLSSECTDFVAMNVACSADIETNCDEAYFSDDTVLCLTEWTDPARLSDRCKSVVAWAVPSKDADEKGPTDELGLSDKDYQEKKEWQEKRKAARGDSIERLKMKEEDAKKETERVELETFKREHPEEYEQMMKQQEEDKRQATEFKKKERMLAAALARKKRQEAGLPEEAEEETEKPKKQKTGKNPKASAPPAKAVGGSNTLMAIMCFLLIAGICAGGAYIAKSHAGGSKVNSARKAAIATKKKRQ